jgi:hypothetical protein
MASIFELEQANFGRATEGRVVLAGTNADTTLTAAQSVESIVTVTPTTGRTYTTATAAEIISELGGSAKVGQCFEITLVNLAGATHAVTFAGGTGVTVSGSATVAAATSATYVGRMASATTVVYYRKGG